MYRACTNTYIHNRTWTLTLTIKDLAGKKLKKLSRGVRVSEHSEEQICGLTPPNPLRSPWSGGVGGFHGLGGLGGFSFINQNDNAN